MNWREGETFGERVLRDMIREEVWARRRRRIWLGLGIIATAALLVIASNARADEIGCVSTTWRLIGANDTVCVQSFADVRIPGVTCHISQAKTGGIGGSIGFATDPSRFSIACRQTGPIKVDLATLPRNEKAFSERTSILFKTTHVIRMVDAPNNTLVYLALSDKLIDGSPQNSISTVPIQPWGK